MQPEWISNIELCVKILKSMTESQLLELFHDIEDIEAVQRIADCAQHFLDKSYCDFCESKNIPKPIVKSGKIITYSTKVMPNTLKELSQNEDAKQIDDSQRYRDIKSEQER